MKILFDHGTPVPLRHALPGHEISTAYEMGWANLQNGDLLAEAEKAFAAFITTDKNLRYQQNLAGRRLAILVLPMNSWPRLQNHLSQIARRSIWLAQTQITAQITSASPASSADFQAFPRCWAWIGPASPDANTPSNIAVT